MTDIASKDELWTLQDIAKYLKRSLDTVTRRISKDPTFPKPVRQLGRVRIHPMYYAAEVKGWVRDQRDVA